MEEVDATEHSGEELPHVPAEECSAFLVGYEIHVQTDGEWLDVTWLVTAQLLHVEKLSRLHGAYLKLLIDIREVKRSHMLPL